MGKFTELFGAKVQVTDPNYKRQMYQTYLTAAEWRIVEMAEEYADFLAKGNTLVRFPYFSQVSTLWQVIANSYRAARKHHSHFQILSSEYMLMNIFFATTITAEYTIKGLFALPFRLFLKQNLTTTQRALAEVNADYAKFIHTIPFYQYNYLAKLKPLWQTFWQTQDKSFTDVLSLSYTSVEFLLKSVVSAPCRWWFTQPENAAPETTDIIVKYSKENENKKRAAKILERKLFKLDSKLKEDKIGPLNVVTKNAQQQLFSRATTKDAEQKKAPKGYAYAHLSAPRYEALTEVVRRLAEKDIKIQEICGQNKVQVRCAVNYETQYTINKIGRMQGVSVLYSYTNSLDDTKFIMLDVNTKKLVNTVKNIEETAGAKVKLIHDF